MRRFFLPVVLLLLAVPAPGETQYTARKEIDDKFRARFGDLSTQTWSDDRRVLLTLAGPTKPIAGAAMSPLTVKNALVEFLDLAPTALRLASDPSCATPSGVVHQEFEQLVDGIPVENAKMMVDVTAENRIVAVFNRTIPDLRMLPAAPQMTAENARCFAIAVFLGMSANCDVSPEIEVPADAAIDAEVTKILYAVHSVARWAWAVELRSRPRGAARRYVIDATHGFVLETRNRVHNAEPRARVFDPNPLTDRTVRSHTDVKLGTPPYKKVELSRLEPPVNGKRSLAGEFAILSDFFTDYSFPNDKIESSGDFEFERGTCGFASAMAYHYITAMQEYVQSLGLTGIFDRRIEVDVRHTSTLFESAYWNVPVGDGEILFGYRHADGKVFQAEDGDVIAHEYGHALQSSQAHGHFDKEGEHALEARAMYEGFADYWAMNMFADAKKAQGLEPKCFGAWIKSSTGTAACTREMDLTLTFDKFKATAGEHENGRIWMAALWGLREALTREVADPIILLSHGSLPDAPSFKEGARAMFSADEARNGANHFDEICKVFSDRKLLVTADCPRKP